MLRVITATFALVLISGCATSPNPYAGFFYSGVKGPNHAIEGASSGAKTGRACAMSVVGVAGWGDASIEAAKRNAGIEEISTVDYEFVNIVGPIYTKTCTLVSGN